MTGLEANRSAARLALAAASALALAGCGGGLGIGLLDYGAAPARTAAAAQPTQGPALPPRTPESAGVQDCPQVEVLEGTSAVRVGGEANSSVRYQYSLGDISRECSVVNGQLAIRVGVVGRVLLGPAGSPGAFQVPLRIAVRREGEQKPSASQFFRVAANVPAGDTQTSFTQISDQLLVPYTGPDANEDYKVVVGFDSGGKVAPAARRRQRRR